MQLSRARSSEEEEGSESKRHQNSTNPSQIKMIFNRSRSSVLSTKWMVATSQPLASAVGSRILSQGGNACDAAIAIAAALAVLEPCSTGLGGDMFALFYDAKTKKVQGLNGSGRSGACCTFETAKKILPPDAKQIPKKHGLAVTVPGCVAGWHDAMKAWGSMPLGEVLKPAIDLARNGFPVSEVTAHWWQIGQHELDEGSCFLPAPTAGSVFHIPDLADTLEIVAKVGKEGFYKGRIAKAICDAVQQRGGVLTMEDLANHETSFVEPIHVRYRNKVDIYECPPNGQGLAALMALKAFENFEPPKSTDGQTARNVHLQIESMRSSFHDARKYIADPKAMRVSTEELLNEPQFAQSRLERINPNKVTKYPGAKPLSSSDTVSFQVVDAFGNAISVVNSTYEGFGSGICPPKTGLSLQNRGCNFSLDESSANRIDASKRPYHTIIPGMSLNSHDQTLHSSFTVMGGFMQPQGHLQIMSNLIDLEDDPQRALDRPRFCILAGNDDGFSTIAIEESMDESIVNALKGEYGHSIRTVKGYDRALFGRGQIILKKGNVYIGGSDARADGCAIPGF